MHVANGMYGLIYVQPEKNPLAPVDREYYVMQGDFYTTGNFGEKGLQPFSMQRAIDENPSYVVFNGSATSLVGDKALQAKVGESVRIFIGNGGPNIVSSFHIIGEIFDSLYPEGGTLASQQNVQTTMVPAGGSAIVEFKTQVPGTFIIVDHSLFRAFNKGALGMLKIAGEENKNIYSGKEVDEVYLGDVGLTNEAGKLREELDKTLKANPQVQKLTKDILIAEGKKTYASNCSMCHQLTGEGIPGVFPPLAKSDYMEKLATDGREALVRIPHAGLSGKITVNGKEYNGAMPAIANISDQELAEVITYVTNSWGNQAKAFSVEEVNAARTSADQQNKK